MTDIYSKKCKIAFWPVFALSVLSAEYTSSHPSESGGGSEGKVSACVLSVALHAEIHVIGDPRALKKIQHQKRQLKSAISSKESWESWSHIACSSSKGLLPFQCSPPGQWELFWFSGFLYVSCISSRTRQIFSLPLHSPQLILFSVQQLKIS